MVIPTASAAVMAKRLLVRRRRPVTPLANATNLVQHSSATDSPAAQGSSNGKACLESAPEVAEQGVDAGLAAYLGAAIGLQYDQALVVSNTASSTTAANIRYVMAYSCPFSS